jgi:hypothetical protein
MPLMTAIGNRTGAKRMSRRGAIVDGQQGEDRSASRG